MVMQEVLNSYFNTWNIDNGATVFREQSGDDYDPKISELLGAFKN